MNTRTLRSVLKSIPVVSTVSRFIYQSLFKKTTIFESSTQYWEDRYRSNGDSGDGSYGRLAQFKAEVINAFVAKNNIQSVAEFGCGDGAQLSLMSYPEYVGIDVSSSILETCKKTYADDDTKSFLHTSDSAMQDVQSDLVLSLDVIYHLVEDEIFDKYMQSIFAAAKDWVIIYSSNFDDKIVLPHVRHRKFTNWIEKKQPYWKLSKKIDQRFPYKQGREEETSLADFFVFERK